MVIALNKCYHFGEDMVEPRITRKEFTKCMKVKGLATANSTIYAMWCRFTDSEYTLNAPCPDSEVAVLNIPTMLSVLQREAVE